MKKLSLMLALVATSSAFAVDKWDFEYSDGVYSSTWGGVFPGSFNNEVLSSITNLSNTLRLTRQGGSGYDFKGPDDVVENRTPAHWGRDCLSSFNNTSEGYFQAEFIGNTYAQVSIDFGDFGGDVDDIILEAWSGVGGVLLNTATFIGYNEPAVSPLISKTLTVGSNSPIGMIRFIGGNSSFPNSMYFDNIVANPVPEPATMLVLGTGVLALIRRRNSR